MRSERQMTLRSFYYRFSASSIFHICLTVYRHFSLLLSKITFRGHIPKNQDVKNLRADEKIVDPGEYRLPNFLYTFVQDSSGLANCRFTPWKSAKFLLGK